MDSKDYRARFLLSDSGGGEFTITFQRRVPIHTLEQLRDAVIEAIRHLVDANPYVGEE